MSNILKKIFAILIFCSFVSVCSINVYAQEKYATEYEKHGDKAYAAGNYQQALDYYMTGRKFLKQNLTLMYKCGQSCLMMKDYDKAEYWYQKVLIENDTVNINERYPDLYLHLAQSAISNGNIIQAQSFLNTCLLDCNDINIRKECKKELAKIDWIIDNDNVKDFNITNLGKNINDETSQINTFILKDSIILFTTPEYKTKYSKGQTYYTDIYNRIYFSYIDGDYYTPAKKLAWGDINKKKTDCSDLFFDTNTLTAYFTYSKVKNGKKTSAIYYSAFNTKDNKWQKPQIFKPLEDDNHSYTHPVIAYNNGECLMYFASDREGGFGNMDIWYIDMFDPKAAPVNLGQAVNTAGDEITPFYDTTDKTLYFASDTHPGFGGFDIFRSQGWKQLWHGVENMMMPINSSVNDMYPYIKDGASEGYFTSNRPTDNNADNKTCCNDIYRFNAKPVQTPVVKQEEKPVEKPAAVAVELPIVLYFHNDSPDAGSHLPTTTLTYRDCYKLYASLSNQYKANRTKGMDDSTAMQRLKEVDEFMTDKLKKNYDKLNDVLDYIIDKLEKGNKVTVHIRGYCSSLYETAYNFNLAERRIVSLENYMRIYKDGVLAKYMDSIANDGKPVLETEHLAIGKLESTSPNPETLEEKRSSVYLPQSMEERRIEIKAVQIRD
ncbi:MAG: PD40 domain-containing protein [Bacteroidales bacterium]|nr:PD40 domain-containing protein [Bacteroidales bacterium]